MNYLSQHITQIISSYQNEIPLASYLKQYTKQHPKLGSRDRKALAEGVYSYYRFAAFTTETDPLQIIANTMGNSDNVFLKKMIGLPETTQKQCYPAWSHHLAYSKGLLKEEWLAAIQTQPQLFIRLRNATQSAYQQLNASNITYEKIKLTDSPLEQNCLRLHNSTDVAKVLKEQDYVVQDAASQASIYIALQWLSAPPQNVWDVCAGAGGKSILLKDIFPHVHLTASDIRKSILHNLKMRFAMYRLASAKTIVIDSTNAQHLSSCMGHQQFDFIICDVPCSGSGTWARTPEQFHFFEPNQLAKFEALQFPIASNALHYLKPGGTMAYITCSIFATENENVVNRLATNHNITVKYQQIINGISEKADCMYLAILQKD